MNVLSAFKIVENKKKVIALVGAGGKSSTMYRLAEEMKSLGKKVLITTTTNIFYPSIKQYDFISISERIEDIFEDIKEVKQGAISIVGSGVKGIDKLKGLPKEWIDLISEREIFDYILVEADGAKRKSIKAPEFHEPVVPNSTDTVIGLVGMDCYEKPINKDWVHRPELFTELVGKQIGDTIDEDSIIKLVMSHEGLFKEAPQHSQKMFFLNKVKIRRELEIAIEIGEKLLAKTNNIDRVIIGEIKEDKPIKELMIKNDITAIIMASGFSRRMGRDKLLLEMKGRRIIETIIDIVRVCNFKDKILVYRNSYIGDLGEKENIRIVLNKAPEQGMSTSLKLGVKAALDTRGYMFFNGDQPLLTKNTVNKLIEAFNDDKGTIIVPKFVGRPGTPVLFHRKWKNELLNVVGDKGGREIIKNNPSEVFFVDIDDKREGMDIDTWEDYKNVCNGSLQESSSDTHEGQFYD